MVVDGTVVVDDVWPVVEVVLIDRTELRVDDGLRAGKDSDAHAAASRPATTRTAHRPRLLPKITRFVGRHLPGADLVSGWNQPSHLTGASTYDPTARAARHLSAVHAGVRRFRA